MKSLWQRNTLVQSQRNVAHHYDLSNELYGLFLDSGMNYSCAYFRSPTDTIEEAQQNKLRHIAAKLDLKPGQRVEFGIADGKRGPQALSVRILDPRPSIVKGNRKAADSLAVQLEDVIVLLDKVASDLKSGRYPSDAHASKIATILRATADDLDV